MAEIKVTTVATVENVPIGVESLKKAVKFAIDLSQQIITATKDGWQWTDSFSFLDEMSALPGVIKTGPQILLELKDLGAEDRVELNKYIQDTFDIPDDKIEGIIEDSLSIAFSIVSLITKLK